MKRVKKILAILAGLWLLGNLISRFLLPTVAGEGPPMHIGGEGDIYHDVNDDMRFYRWNEEDSVWIKTRHTTTSRKIHEESLKEGVERSNSQCNGPGNSACEFNVQSHVNSQQGKEVNYISHAGKGVFDVNIVDVNRGNSYSAKFYTDCNCNVSRTKVY